jgi:hypothetical protein
LEKGLKKTDEYDPHTHTATLPSAISHRGSASRPLSFGMITSYGIAYLRLHDASSPSSSPVELSVRNHRSRVLPSSLRWTTTRQPLRAARLTWLFRQ